ncbi:4-(cytidine 5'-diphospho)-2-C-methyl-D-erythritol kinase [Sulfitobacter aestuarii]|uniref:4-diphosphocytidyl-2-C-methyl-D-erythritol kinase n=1 Tax=Sulfitobacter aestuarii TaxID=2161676 RepID=A0ABW5U2X9_9RHOB
MNDADSAAAPVRWIERQGFAKINLTLHVTGQRQDGYHLLDSLVVRAGVGDRIRVTAAETLSLKVNGPLADGVPVDARNLVLRAAEFLDDGAGRGATIHLTKNLPPASGIGGGSADAAATLQALAELWSVPLPVDVSSLGADVPVCMETGPQRMSGVGERLIALPALPPCWLVLVNPHVAVTTPAVFESLENKQNPAMARQIPIFSQARDVAEWLATQRNDLQAPALKLVPQIAACLGALEDALLARMSGSGATCFGLFASADAAEAAAARITRDHPDWWVASAPLLS